MRSINTVKAAGVMRDEGDWMPTGGVFTHEWAESCCSRWLSLQSHDSFMRRVRPVHGWIDGLWVSMISDFDRLWQHEFNRRFLLRSLGPQPNTQDGTMLVRAI